MKTVTIVMACIMTAVVAAIVWTIGNHFANDNNKKYLVVKSIGIGLVMAVLNNYLVPLFPEWSWLFLAMAIAFICGLMYQWSRKGTERWEFVCFTILTLITCFIAVSAAENYAPIIIFPMIIAIIIPIFAIGFYAFMALRFQRKWNTLNDEEREMLIDAKKGDTIESMDAKAKKFGWSMTAVAVATFVVMAFATGVVLGMANSGIFDGEGERIPDSSIAETVSADDGDLDSRFVQEWTKNENNRLDSEFAAKLAKKAEADDGTITPEIVQEAVLENCGHDARMLAIWANAFELRDNPNEYDDLLTEDKTYLSDEGISLYNKVEGYLAATAVTREKAPESGTNTGYSDNTYVVASEAGITGDRSATRFVSPDEGVEPFWLMDRCSNLVYNKPPKKVPEGPTDQPTPDSPKNMKDQSKIPKKNTEPNDDKGPGEKTIGSDPNHSTKDRKDNSTSGSYQDYKNNLDNLKDTNQNQKTGSDSNKPSTPAPKPNTNVDNNGDKGTGNGGINTPTPKRESETVKNDPPADHMDEPS